MRLVGIDEIRAAAKRIDATVAHTALLPANWAGADRPLWIKPEGFQAIGAFKVRGAANALAELDESARANGVVAYSSGNHAQAVAHAARAAGIPAVIVIDDTAPVTKIEATRALGAEVVLVPLTERQKLAEEIARQRNAALIPPFDHPAVIAGQGTIGLEIAEELPDVELVLIPISGGGLASGIAAAIKALCPTAKVFGVEPELAGDAAASYAAGHLVRWPSTDRVRTIADGLRAEPSELTFAHFTALLDGILTVSEQEIRDAMKRLALGSGLVAEPAGAVATAAYLYRQAELPPGRTVAILSGRNVDPELFAEVLGG